MSYVPPHKRTGASSAPPPTSPPPLNPSPTPSFSRGRGTRGNFSPTSPSPRPFPAAFSKPGYGGRRPDPGTPTYSERDIKDRMGGGISHTFVCAAAPAPPPRPLPDTVELDAGGDGAQHPDRHEEQDEEKGDEEKEVEETKGEGAQKVKEEEQEKDEQPAPRPKACTDPAVAHLPPEETISRIMVHLNAHLNPPTELWTRHFTLLPTNQNKHIPLFQQLGYKGQWVYKGRWEIVRWEVHKGGSEAVREFVRQRRASQGEKSAETWARALGDEWARVELRMAADQGLGNPMER